MSNSRRAGWQLPPGVAPGTWEYVHSESIAKDYDRYFAGHALFALDRELLDRWFEPVATGDSVAQWTVVADLGCGTARGLETLLERGYHGLAVDLSGQMLEVVGEKRARLNWPVMRVRANLVELDGLRDQSLDHAICLFSTLGMVKTTAARRRMLEHVVRSLKPGGTLVVHVHNLWANLFFPGGWRWILASGLRSLRDREHEWGDKVYAYRGLSRMFLHVFRRSEILKALREVGLAIDQVVPLDGHLSAPLTRPWWLGRLRASGWVIRARRPVNVD